MWDRLGVAPCAHLLPLLLLPHPPASADPPVPPRPFWVTVLGLLWDHRPLQRPGASLGPEAARQGREDASRRAQLSPFVKSKRPGQEGRAKVTPTPALPGGVAGFSENHRPFFPFLSLILAQTEGFSPSPISYATSERANLQSFLQQTLVWPSRGRTEAGRGNPRCVYVNPLCRNELRSGSAPDASLFSEIVPLASRRRKRPGTLGTVLRPGQGTVTGGGTAWGLSRSTKTIVKQKRRKREHEVSLFDRRAGGGSLLLCPGPAF